MAKKLLRMTEERQRMAEELLRMTEERQKMAEEPKKLSRSGKGCILLFFLTAFARGREGCGA